MRWTFKTELQQNGQWVAQVEEVDGTRAWGSTEVEAIRKARELAERRMFGF